MSMNHPSRRILGTDHTSIHRLGIGCLSQTRLPASIHQYSQRMASAYPRLDCAMRTLNRPWLLISYFFSVVGGSVKIYSVATGQVISTLSTSSTSGDHPQVITSAILNPHNAFQLITGSLDGSIVIWDILDGVVLQTIDISQPIHHMCAHEKFKDHVFVAVNRSGANKSATGQYICMSLQGNDPILIPELPKATTEWSFACHSPRPLRPLRLMFKNHQKSLRSEKQKRLQGLLCLRTAHGLLLSQGTKPMSQRHPLSKLVSPNISLQRVLHASRSIHRTNTLPQAMIRDIFGYGIVSTTMCQSTQSAWRRRRRQQLFIGTRMPCRP